MTKINNNFKCQKDLSAANCSSSVVLQQQITARCLRVCVSVRARICDLDVGKPQLLSNFREDRVISLYFNTTFPHKTDTNFPQKCFNVTVCVSGLG